MNSKYLSLFALTLSSAGLIGAQKSNCKPETAAKCYPDDCCRTYCAGPDNYAGLAPVNPRTCNGDIVLTIAGFYWNAHIDGMEYAVETDVVNTNEIQRGHIINGDFKSPNFDWNFGFKLGLGYNTTCDGWDIGILWTSYKGSASSHVEAENEDNHTLLTLWSDVRPANPTLYPLWVTDIETKWKLSLNLIDLELGRNSWLSKRLSMRPHIGLRIAYIKQDFEIEQKGGFFTSNFTPDVNDFVDLDNDFKGIGFRGGFDTVWNVGCGWGIYGNLALSVIYGRFEIEHEERTREAEFPFDKTVILKTRDSFRTTRYTTDVGIGLRYATEFCKCQYALAVSLGWEQHLFLGQNQLWRVVRDTEDLASSSNNIFQQRRGDLDTQGWTLKVVFDF